MTLRWNKNTLNRYVAPNITEFVSADIADLRPEFAEWKHWITNHFLNNVLRGSFKEPWRQYAVNFIRRSQATFRFYHDARDLTASYLDTTDPLNPNVARYYHLLSFWEVAFMNWAICLDIISRLRGELIFKRNDGSSEQRAYDLNNTIKHHAADIQAGRLAGDDLLAFWLTPTGLRSKSEELTYAEFADLVRDIAKLSTDLQDARTFLQPQQ
jgi:hypothetical protein